MPESSRMPATAKCEVSIVIPTMDTCELLRACLLSIEKQRCDVEMEVIVVDNASRDSTVSMLRECFPWVTVVECAENKGYSGGANVGLGVARGELLVILNSDTVLLEGTIRKLHDELCRRPDVGAGCPRLADVDGNLLPMRGSIMTISDHLRLINLGNVNMRAYDSSASRYIEVPLGACLCLTRRGLDAIGQLDERLPMYLEEEDVARRLLRFGLRCYFVADAVVKHVGGQTVRLLDPNEAWLAAHLSHAHFYDTHFPRPIALGFRANAAAWMLIRISKSLIDIARGDERAVFGRARLRAKLAALRGYLSGRNRRIRRTNSTQSSANS